MLAVQVGDEMLGALRQIEDGFQIDYLGAGCTYIGKWLRQKFEYSTVILDFLYQVLVAADIHVIYDCYRGIFDKIAGLNYCPGRTTKDKITKFFQREGLTDDKKLINFHWCM